MRHDSLIVEDAKETNDLYGLSDGIAPLLNDDIIKISNCVHSGNITLVRKATELLWMNLEDTTQSTDPETVCTYARNDYAHSFLTRTLCQIKLSLDCAKIYLFKAFQFLEDADELFAFNTTEFYYTEITTKICVDRETLKRGTKICLKAFHAATHMMDNQGDCSIATVDAIEATVKAISDVIAGIAFRNHLLYACELRIAKF